MLSQSETNYVSLCTVQLLKHVSLIEYFYLCSAVVHNARGILILTYSVLDWEFIICASHNIGISLSKEAPV